MTKEEILKLVNKEGAFEAGRSQGYQHGFVNGCKAERRKHEHHYNTTVGLWATDKPEMIPHELKDVFFQIKAEDAPKNTMEENFYIGQQAKP